PAAGFQPAIGIDPELVWIEYFQRLVQQPGHFRLVRHAWRVDVVHARTDAIGVIEAGEGIQQFHARAAGLDRDHVRIHGRHGPDDVVEFRVAHVAVDLRGIAHAAGADAEAFHGPGQV